MSTNGPSSSAIPEWFLRVEETRTGPYSAEQIAGLLEDGEILSHHQVTCARLQGKWISVEELVHAHLRVVQDAKSERPFVPPPRPEGVGEITGLIETTLAASEDPANELFDALQIAREKKSGITLLPSAQSSGRKPLFGELTLRDWLIGGSAAVVLLAGLTALLFRAPSGARQAAVNRPAPAPPVTTTPPPSSSHLRTFSNSRPVAAPVRPVLAPRRAPAPRPARPVARPVIHPKPLLRPDLSPNWRRAELNRADDRESARDLRRERDQQREQPNSREQLNSDEQQVQDQARPDPAQQEDRASDQDFAPRDDLDLQDPQDSDNRDAGQNGLDGSNDPNAPQAPPDVRY